MTNWKAVNPRHILNKDEIDKILAKYQPKVVGYYEENGHKITIYEERCANGTR